MVVVEEIDLNIGDNIARVCALPACERDSVVARVTSAAADPAGSYIATPASSWLDDLLTWVDPALNHCCRETPEGGFCPPPQPPECGPCLTREDYVGGLGMRGVGSGRAVAFSCPIQLLVALLFASWEKVLRQMVPE